MFSFEILTLASEDIEEIYQYYEEQLFGLGDEFLAALDHRFSDISKFPHQCEEKYRGIRKAFTERFPYVIYYKIHPNNLIVVHAVLHMSRHSVTWKSRVSEKK